MELITAQRLFDHWIEHADWVCCLNQVPRTNASMIVTDERCRCFVFEKYIAPVKFMPYELLMNRNILGANLLAGFLSLSFSTWNSHFVSFLRVVQ